MATNEDGPYKELNQVSRKNRLSESATLRLQWPQDLDAHCRSDVGSNKSEQKNECYRAVFFNRLSEMRDRPRRPEPRSASGLNFS